MRAWAATVRRVESALARGGISRALEEWGIRVEEDLGGSTDVVLRDERDTKVGGGQAGMEKKNGIHLVARVREHAACPSFRLRGDSPNSGR